MTTATAILAFVVAGFVFGVVQGIQKEIQKRRTKAARRASFDEGRRELRKGNGYGKRKDDHT